MHAKTHSNYPEANGAVYAQEMVNILCFCAKLSVGIVYEQRVGLCESRDWFPHFRAVNTPEMTNTGLYACILLVLTGFGWSLAWQLPRWHKNGRRSVWNLSVPVRSGVIFGQDGWHYWRTENEIVERAWRNCPRLIWTAENTTITRYLSFVVHLSAS